VRGATTVQLDSGAARIEGSHIPVDSQHPSYKDARPQWDRCRDAFAGSDAVKNKHTAYLPMLEGQKSWRELPYLGYRARALYYPAMGRTVSGLLGVLFGKDITVENVPDAFKDEVNDVTLTGTTIQQFGLLLGQELLVTGRVGALIDMSDAGGSRPYWCAYLAENIINWRTDRGGVGGAPRVTLVVLAEYEEVQDDKDEFVIKHVLQYRVLQLEDGRYAVKIYQQNTNKQGEWILTSSFYPTHRGAPLDYIPFVFIGPNGISPVIEHPPLLDLVDVNLSHYRTSADQEHGAHFTALPTPYITGHTLGQGETLAIGSGTAWILPNPSATAGMVEFSGAGLGALAALKEEKRQLMATLGARMLETQKNVQEAATSLRMRHSSERASLSVLASSISQAMTIALHWHLIWNGVDEKVAAEARIELNPDVMDELTSDDIAKLVAAWQAGAISHKTLYYNLEWGEWTRPSVLFEEEQADIDEETPEPILDLLPPIPPKVDDRE
jgi:hypothetical protein